MSDKFDPMSPNELNDKGPWSVSDDGRTIESDDFTHDVQLKVTGDFYHNQQRKAYSENLAALLNRTKLTETQRLLDEANAKVAEYDRRIVGAGVVAMESVSRVAYEAAVKGRQDFRDALESERGKVKRLVDGIKNLRDVKGRFHTEQATNKLFALLTELGEG